MLNFEINTVTYFKNLRNKEIRQYKTKHSPSEIGNVATDVCTFAEFIQTTRTTQMSEKLPLTLKGSLNEESNFGSVCTKNSYLTEIGVEIVETQQYYSHNFAYVTEL
jgi:hypothetical protein